jgi:hypothetical protein
MPILIRENGGGWKKAEEAGFANESELQKMLYESPELVSGDGVRAVFIREAGLPGSGYTDLVSQGSPLRHHSRKQLAAVIGQLCSPSSTVMMLDNGKLPLKMKSNREK